MHGTRPIVGGLGVHSPGARLLERLPEPALASVKVCKAVGERPCEVNLLVSAETIPLMVRSHHETGMLFETRTLCKLICEDVIRIGFTASESLQGSNPWQFRVPLACKRMHECLRGQGGQAAHQSRCRRQGWGSHSPGQAAALRVQRPLRTAGPCGPSCPLAQQSSPSPCSHTPAGQRIMHMST